MRAANWTFVGDYCIVSPYQPVTCQKSTISLRGINPKILITFLFFLHTHFQQSKFIYLSIEENYKLVTKIIPHIFCSIQKIGLPIPILLPPYPFSPNSQSSLGRSFCSLVWFCASFEPLKLFHLQMLVYIYSASIIYFFHQLNPLQVRQI
jgi:hypothetical protein